MNEGSKVVRDYRVKCIACGAIEHVYFGIGDVNKMWCTECGATGQRQKLLPGKKGWSES